MCGIAGCVLDRPIEEHLPSAFLKSLRHRGPDDEGTYLSPERRVALVHTRLSILDLSPAGHQPMTNEDGTLWLTYNGEIYNHPELRAELLAKGHRFSSRTDSEVILHLYEEEQESAVRRLRGMFAFALYDHPRRRLLLARDRLGIKPLYYADLDGLFCFASEIKAILASGLVPPRADWQALWDYFTFLFIPHPETAFEGIRQVPPAHWLLYDLTARRHRMERYWTPWEGLSVPPADYPALREQVRHLVQNAVRGELASDVPLGVFFSGGIDSTVLAAIVARHSSRRVKTFTVGFRAQGYYPHDDLSYARQASKALGTEHQELIVDLTDPRDLLAMVRWVDQPFGNPTLYLQYLIAEATRKQVTVALSGVGADELFGGYPKYWLFPSAPFLSRLPAGLGRLGLSWLNLVREDTWVPVLRKAKRALKGLGCDLPEQYLRWSYYLTEGEKKRLLAGPLGSASFQPTNRWIRRIFESIPPGANRYQKVLGAELETFLADNLLEYTDKASMAVALETRVPFLDHRLVELGVRIPFSDKMRPYQSKHILVDAFRDLLPSGIARVPKRGFSPPIAQWMDQILEGYFDELMGRDQVEREGIFRWETLQALRLQHRGKRRDASLDLLAVLMFTVWYRHYILKGGS